MKDHSTIVTFKEICFKDYSVITAFTSAIIKSSNVTVKVLSLSDTTIYKTVLNYEEEENKYIIKEDEIDITTAAMTDNMQNTTMNKYSISCKSNLSNLSSAVYSINYEEKFSLSEIIKDCFITAVIIKFLTVKSSSSLITSEDHSIIVIVKEFSSEDCSTAAAIIEFLSIITEVYIDVIHIYELTALNQERKNYYRDSSTSNTSQQNISSMKELLNKKNNINKHSNKYINSAVCLISYCNIRKLSLSETTENCFTAAAISTVTVKDLNSSDIYYKQNHSIDYCNIKISTRD